MHTAHHSEPLICSYHIASAVCVACASVVQYSAESFFPHIRPSIFLFSARKCFAPTPHTLRLSFGLRLATIIALALAEIDPLNGNSTLTTAYFRVNTFFAWHLFGCPVCRAQYAWMCELLIKFESVRR